MLQALVEDNADLTDLTAEEAKRIVSQRREVRELGKQLEFYNRDTPDHLYVETANQLKSAQERLSALFASHKRESPQVDWHHSINQLQEDTAVVIPWLSHHGAAVVIITKDERGQTTFFRI